METRKLTLADIADDVLLCIFIFLDMETIYSMQFVSSYFKAKIKNILKLEHVFQKLVEECLTLEQFQSSTNEQRRDYKKWKAHFFPAETIKLRLESNCYFSPR
ncbi:MAG: hypothetical protein JO149_00685, partial [Gammaproteobacteria bacterium]|nr:hypothetical protein [Gammaproteobacteria bacterium]